MSLKRGDTIIEILFALSVFSLVAILSLNLMNNGVVSAQASLENTMVRNEINAQAEALRFIHDTVTAGSADQSYKQAWEQITTLANDNGFPDSTKMEKFIYPPDHGNVKNSCETYYEEGNNNIASKNAFILNTRHLKLAEGERSLLATPSDTTPFKEAGNYARVVYKKSSGTTEEAGLQTDTGALQVAGAEGIWVIGAPSANKIYSLQDKTSKPQYYDFYIQSCWYNPGKDTPTTIGTVISLYEPAEVRHDEQ